MEFKFLAIQTLLLLLKSPFKQQHWFSARAAANSIVFMLQFTGLPVWSCRPWICNCSLLQSNGVTIIADMVITISVIASATVANTPCYCSFLVSLLVVLNVALLLFVYRLLCCHSSGLSLWMKESGSARGFCLLKEAVPQTDHNNTQNLFILPETTFRRIIIDNMITWILHNSLLEIEDDSIGAIAGSLPA